MAPNKTGSSLKVDAMLKEAYTSAIKDFGVADYEIEKKLERFTKTKQK